MKNQALFSSKDKSETLKCHLLQFLFGALRIKPAEKSQLAVVVQFLSVFYGIALFMGLQQ